MLYVVTFLVDEDGGAFTKLRSAVLGEENSDDLRSIGYRVGTPPPPPTTPAPATPAETSSSSNGKGAKKSKNKKKTQNETGEFY